MDEDLILREIVKSLAFEIEAVNQDNVLKWSTTNGTPLNVKVRVRNKDEPRLVQRGTMPVPRIGISAPEKLTLVSSNQTILSFSVYLEEELERKDEQKRHSGFKLFNIGSCLGTFSDDVDEGPYLPSSSNHINALESNSTIISSSGILKKKVSPVLSKSNTAPRSKKTFFGKCKPGGCLDPPFGEDNYSYGLGKKDRQENLRLELHEPEDAKKTCKPGGCFDSPFSEENSPYALSNTDHQEKLELKFEETAYNNNSMEINKKTSERSRGHETFIQKTNKDEGEPKKLTDAGNSEDNSLKLKYSNSIITYPTAKHSKERVSDQIPNKKISIKINDDDSFRKSYEYPESYFVPPKDVLRYKEEERRHERRLSTDQLSRSSKDAAHDATDKPNLLKTLSKQSKDIPQSTKGSIDTLTGKTNLILPQQTIATKSTNNNTKNAQDDINIAKMQVNHDMPPIQSSSSEKISKLSPIVSNKNKAENLQDDIDVVGLLVKREKPPTRRTSRDTMNKLSHEKINKNKTENLEDSMHIPRMQVNEDKLTARDTSKKTISKLFSKESNNNEPEVLQNDIDVVEFLIKQDIPSTQRNSREAMNKLSSNKIDMDNTENLEDSIHIAKMQVEKGEPSVQDMQILDSRNAQKQDQVEVKTQPMQALEKFVNTDTQTPTHVTQKFKSNGNDINDKMKTIIPILATTATVVLTEKQYLQYKNKPNAVTDTSMKENNVDSLSNPEGYAQKTDKQKLQEEPGNVSPNYISSTENSDFDISSTHSMDFIQELSSTGKSNSLLDTSSQKNKGVSPANNNIKEKNDLRNIKQSSETAEKKRSAILQKNPFVTKHDTDIYNDDVSKATPLKRNTFTIIGSDTSLQKNEEILNLPENKTNALLKTTDKTKSGSPLQTRESIDILDTINQKSEYNIHTRSAIDTDNLKDVYTNITRISKPNSDDQACIKEESSDKSTKRSENIFVADIDKNLKPENLVATNYQTKTLDTSSKGIIHTNSLHKQLPMNAKDYTSHSNFAKDGESTIDVQNPPKTDLLDAKDRAEYTNNKDISTLHKMIGQSRVSNNLEKDSSQTLLPDNVKHFDLESKGENNLTDIYQQYKAKNKDGHALQNPEPDDTDYMCSKIITDRNIVPDDPTSDKIVLLREYDGLDLDSIQKHISKNKQEAYPTVYDAKAALSTRQYDKLEIAGIETKENNIYDNDKLITETLQKPMTKTEKVLLTRIADKSNLVSIGSKSDEMGRLDSNSKENQNKMYDTPNISSKQKLISTHDLQSVMTDKIQGKTETEYGIYNEADSGNHEKSAINPFLKIKPENIQNLHAEVTDDIKDISFDQIYDKSEFLHIINERPQTFMTEHVEDFNSVMTTQIGGKTEIKNQIYNDNLKYIDSAKDDSLRMKIENVQHFHVQATDGNEHVSSGQIYDNITFLDTQSIDPIQKFIPEHVKDLHVVMADKSNDKTDIKDQECSEMDNFNYSESVKDDLLQIKSENFTKLRADTVGDIKYVSSSQISHEKNVLMNTENNKPAQKVLPEQARDLYSVNTDKIHNKTDINDQIYEELYKVVYNELTVDDSLNHTQTSDVDDYISSGSKYVKAEFLDLHSNESQIKIYQSDTADHDVYSRKHPEQTEVTQILTDNFFGFKEKSRSASKNDSPFSGYSGLISEVLSNISENTEGEEKHTVLEVGEDISEDFAISDSKAYQVHEMLDNDFPNIVEEAGFAKSNHHEDDIDKIDDGSYKVPQNSLAKSFTSAMEESDENRQKKTIAKESMQSIAHSSDELRHRFDEYSTDTLNIGRDDVLLDTTIDITNQTSECQSSKFLGSINDSIVLNKDDSLFRLNEQHLAKQKERKSIERKYQSRSSVYKSNIDRTETTSLKKDPVYLDMSFYSYMNDNNQRVVQTHSPVIEQRSHDATVTVVKTLIRHGNEIRIPVDTENDISLNILDKDVRITNKGRTIESTSRDTRREKHSSTVALENKTAVLFSSSFIDESSNVNTGLMYSKDVFDRAKRHEVLNKNLALIYEHELIPLHNVIKDLTQEVNTLSTQQENLQMKIRNVRRTKSLRLIPVVKRCGCRRI